VALCAAAWLIPAGAAADPVVLASIPVSSNGITAGGTTGYVTFAMGWGNWLFTEHPITSASVGTTFVADRSNDPQFAEIARKMTNGRHSYTEVLFGAAPMSGGGTGWGSEAQMYQLGPAAIDFRGATITALTLRVDAFDVSPSTDWPGMNTFSFAGRLSVLGEGVFDPAPVPEPATLTLLTTGVVGIYAARRRKRASEQPGGRRA
jgi:hypothetical protein